MNKYGRRSLPELIISLKTFKQCSLNVDGWFAAALVGAATLSVPPAQPHWPGLAPLVLWNHELSPLDPNLAELQHISATCRLSHAPSFHFPASFVRPPHPPSFSTSTPELYAGRLPTTHRLVSRSKPGQQREALAALQWLFQRPLGDNAFFPCHKADALL